MLVGTRLLGIAKGGTPIQVWEALKSFGSCGNGSPAASRVLCRMSFSCRSLATAACESCAAISLRSGSSYKFHIEGESLPSLGHLAGGRQSL